MTDPILALFPASPEDEKDIQRWFIPVTETCASQDQAVNSIRAAGRILATAILRNLPRCADRTAAIRKVREAVSTAQEGILAERSAYDAVDRVRTGL